MFEKLKSVVTKTTPKLAEMETITPEKTTSELVQEIHDNFFTEVDRLLEESKIIIPLESEIQDILDKAEILHKLGFHNSKDSVDAKEEKDRLLRIRIENDKKRNIASAIRYFSTKYPQYKFITGESIYHICNRYGLIYGDVKYYIGSVPTKNVEQMNEFKIDDMDKCYVHTIVTFTDTSERFLGFEDYKKAIKEEKRIKEEIRERREKISSWVNSRFNEAPLIIAAPKSDFDTKSMNIINHELVNKPAPDPVVFQPVVYEQNKYYLIVTAWGDEANDKDVVNERMN